MEKSEVKKPYSKGFEAIPKKGGGYSFRCQVSVNGQIKRRTFSTLKLAKQWKSKMVTLREENKANGIRFQNGTLFGDLCDEFLTTRVGTKESTRKAYVSTVRTHLMDQYGHMPLRDIKEKHGLTLQGYLEAKDHSHGGINKIVQLFSSILDYGVKTECLERNPFKNIKRLKVDAAVYDYWTKVEIDKFLTAPSTIRHEFYNIFRFALNTGLRRGEMCGLLWKNVTIDGDNAHVIFNEQLTPDMVRTLVKGHAKRSVSLAPGAVKILKELGGGAPGEYVFKTEKGLPVPPNDLTKQWRVAQIAAGFKRTMKLHGARHSFASFLVSKGVSLVKVQQLLGHTDSKVTQRYSHLNSADERDAVKIVDFG